ncbi:tRNA 2-thiocytidine(32) synthetase TtcA [Persicobacter diffluens]|uniref:tRNA-cytidine(32) 2-sulfurtransferase n=1 Tax=Persicobacter diffluens TaxID=981 RepID=A0AAN5AN41_9BACT|nr:tRNA 2-thiocytidine biosynthesis protein TtcA [Persicobacter diffluens]
MENLGTEKKAAAKVKKKLTSNTSKAMMDFGMVEAGDKIMVCLSGGKDSYTLLDMMLHTQKVVPFHFDIVAVNLDQKQPGFPEHILPDYLKNLGVDFQIIEKDTYSIVKEKVPEGKTTCSLCSRLRRGNLYDTAKKLGANKLALGHHQDDIIETFFLNLLFSGKMEAMPAKYLTDDGSLTVLRPMAYCRERDIATYAEIREFPIIPCNLCGSQPKLQRQTIKAMLNTWEQAYPDRIEIIFNALQNVSPSHLLDPKLFDFFNMHGKDLSEYK